MFYRSARTTLTIFVFLFFAPYAVAEEVQLEAAEIEELLAGNTISGTWSGTQYKQFYEADGLTVYVPDGGSADEGKWRVDPATDNYESWWEATGWVGYQIVRDGDTYYWVDGDGGRHPFVVLEGKQVSW
jgi:hypothetical protein